VTPPGQGRRGGTAAATDNRLAWTPSMIMNSEQLEVEVGPQGPGGDSDGLSDFWHIFTTARRRTVP
jgi:hypothetical protein